jgi:hypothetical protein
MQPGDGVVIGHPVEMLAFRRYTKQELWSYTWLEEPDLVASAPKPDC